MYIADTGIRLKDVHEVLLEMLIEFDRICKKNNLNYQLYSGTLLGAIRHQGFIPWDDDLDISMLRNDYNKFLEVCKNDLDSKYFMQTCFTDPGYLMQFGKIRKNNTIYLEKNSAECDMHHGIFIDIFPLDAVIPHTLKGKFQRNSLFVLNRLNLTRVKTICRDTDNCICKVMRFIPHYFMYLIPRSFIAKLQGKICCMCNNDKNIEYVSHLTNGSGIKRYNRFTVKKSYYDDLIEVKFEGNKFPVPRDYDQVLLSMYKDYKNLPPIKERNATRHQIIKVVLDTNGICE